MRYAHTNICAKDWKKLADFYISVFDCTLKPPERKLSGEWLDRAIGLTDTKLEGAHLLLPGCGENAPLCTLCYKFGHCVIQLAEGIMETLSGMTVQMLQGCSDIGPTAKEEGIWILTLCRHCRPGNGPTMPTL